MLILGNEEGLLWLLVCFFFSSRRRHTRSYGDWSSDVCSSDLQNGARAQCAEPVTGSSGTPLCGAKNRDTKSKPGVVARLVTMTPRASTRSSAAKIGRASCRERVESAGVAVTVKTKRLGQASHD